MEHAEGEKGSVGTGGEEAQVVRDGNGGEGGRDKVRGAQGEGREGHDGGGQRTRGGMEEQGKQREGGGDKCGVNEGGKKKGEPLKGLPGEEIRGGE